MSDTTVKLLIDSENNEITMVFVRDDGGEARITMSKEKAYKLADRLLSLVAAPGAPIASDEAEAQFVLKKAATDADE